MGNMYAYIHTEGGISNQEKTAKGRFISNKHTQHEAHRSRRQTRDVVHERREDGEEGLDAGEEDGDEGAEDVEDGGEEVGEGGGD